MSKVKDTFFGGAEKRAGRRQAESFRAAGDVLKKQAGVTRADLLQGEQDAQRAILSGQTDATGSFLGGQEQAKGSFLRGEQEGISSLLGSMQFQQEQLRPFQDTGVRASQMQESLIGGRGEEASRQALTSLGSESPGQQFIRQRQEKALLRNASAIGGLGGGNVRTALQEQAAGFAQQDFQNQFDRLGVLAGRGLQAATETGRSGIATGQGVADIRFGTGGRLAQSELGTAGRIGQAELGTGINLANLATGTAGQLGQFGEQTAANVANTLTGAGAATAQGITGQAAGLRAGIQQVAGGVAGAITGGPLGALEGFAGV